MAVIRRIESQRSFDIGGIPSTQINDGIGRGLQQAGAAISDYAATRQQMEMRLATMQMDSEDFAQAQELARFKTTFAGKFAEMQTSMDPKGLDFAKKTLENFDKEANTFLAKVPRSLQPKYSELISTARTTVGEQAVAAELDRRDKWFATGVADRTNELGAAVAQNPDLFDLSLEDGNTFIDSTGWPQIRKADAKKFLRQQLELAKAGHFERVDPDYLLGPKAPTFASDAMLRAIESVESSGDPSAVSPAGATGLMQVMPGTAREIARELGDTAFPASGTDAEVQTYLKDKAVSRRYGAHYFGKMLQRYEGDTEAALVAYNAGPARADRWLNSGRDDSTIPAETRAYKSKVLAKAGDVRGGGHGAGADLPVITRKGGGRVSTPDMSGVQPAVLDRFKQVQNVFGRSIPIVSGYRDAGRNKRAGGAKSSQHIHGNALDLDVSDMSNAERIELIKTASALGFTGIGVYANSIHLDVGPRRSWGPSHLSDSVPGWAGDAIKEHLAGTAQPQGGVGGNGGVYLHPDFANLPVAERLAIYDRAVAASQKRLTAMQQADTAEMKRRADLIDVGIETNQVTSREQILGAGLRDVDTAKFLRRFDERNREDNEARATLSALAGGGDGARVNPFDSDEVKAAENAYRYLRQVSTPEDIQERSAAFVQSSGYIPRDMQADLRRGAVSKDVGEFNAAMTQADALQRVAPTSFDNFEGGNDVRGKLAMYQGFVNDLGMSGETAARRILSLDDPERKASREVLKTRADKLVKDLEVADISSEFGFWFGRGTGATPGQQNVLTREYQELAREYFYEKGDEAAAKALAKADIRKRWGISEISGSQQLMRYPPEKHYPPISGNFDYLREDAMQAAQEFVAANYPGRTVDAVALRPSRNGETRADIAGGRPPRYELVYLYTENGQKLSDYVWSGLWGVDEARLGELLTSDSGTRRQSFMQQHDLSGREIDMRRAIETAPDGGRQQALDAFLAGPPLPPGQNPPTLPSTTDTPESQLREQRRQLFDDARDAGILPEVP